jgi:transglutaminase-like putative cysteine protease
MQQPGLALSNFWGRPAAAWSTRTNRYDSDVSTRDTIRVMRRMAHGYSSDVSVVTALNHALSSGVRSERDVACAIFNWVRLNIRFVEDETLLYQQLGIEPEELDKELLIVPPVLLAMPIPQGDCDDFSLLIASMLLCAGLRSYFVTVAADPTDPLKFSHIYICVQLRDESTHLALDAGNRLTLVTPGWEVSRVTRKAIWAI